MTVPLKISLLPREPPLTPAGVVARTPLALLAAATTRALERGADLTVASGAGWLLVLGDAGALPWADGCTYVGYDGPVLVPTTRRLSPVPDLAARAVLQRAPGGLAVVLDGHVLHGPAPTGAVDLEQLRRCR